MRWHGRAVFVAALLMAVALVPSTGGISSTAAGRDANVAVVSDDEAYLGVERDCVNGTLHVTMDNRFPAGTNLDVDITVNGTSKTIRDLSPDDEPRTREFESVDSGDTISVHASDAITEVHLTRPVPEDC